MVKDKADENRVRFKELLFKMAESQDILSSKKEKREIYLELEDMYHGKDGQSDFRHFYSDIFAVLSQIENDTELGNIEILNQNMNILRQCYIPMNRDSKDKKIDIRVQLDKMYDHINLDIARINYFKTIELRSKGELQKLNGTLEEVELKIKDAENAIEKADDMQNQYITILGIFASIVLAFTGGIAFSTSLLENINGVSVYRLTFVGVGMAFVLINVIYILTRFIIIISKKEYKTDKYSEYIKRINIIIIMFSIIITVCWFFDIRQLAEIFRKWIY